MVSTFFDVMVPEASPGDLPSAEIHQVHPGRGVPGARVGRGQKGRLGAARCNYLQSDIENTGYRPECEKASK
jgi:hypothetical protein